MDEIMDITTNNLWETLRKLRIVPHNGRWYWDMDANNGEGGSVFR